jgi:cellulose synthase operon protein C
MNMRPIHGWSTMLALSALLLLAACGARLSADERLDLARAHLGKGDAPTAVVHLKNVLQEDPSNVDARVLLADASLAAGDYDGAAKEYMRAVELGADLGDFRLSLVEALARAGGNQEVLRYTDPAEVGDDPALSYWRALALGRLGRAEEAQQAFEALRALPEFTHRAELGLARIALGSQRAEEALELLEPLAGPLANDADYWEVQAFAMVQTGQPNEAAEAFGKAADVVVDPLGARRFRYRAGEVEALLGAGRLDEARTLATALHRQAERHPIANYLMSRVELQAGNADLALAHAQAVLATESTSAVGNMMAGAASLSLGQTIQAERYLERALASDPESVPIRRLLAQTRLGLQSPERALEVLGPTLSDGRTDPTIATLAGMANVRAGDPNAAVDIFRRQLEQDPGNEDARLMLAISLMTAGRTEEALVELGNVRAADDVTRQRADLIGIAAHLQANDLLAARSLATRVAEAAPDNAALYSTLGAIFQGAGQLDEAVAWFEAALERGPDNTAAAFNLGRISASRGEIDRSIALFDGILAREPDNAAVLSARGQVDWVRGERDSAISRLERARALDPADSSSRFILTQMLAATGRSAEAVQVAREAADLAPDSAPIVNAYGVVLLDSGQPRDALPQFQRAHKSDPLQAIYLLNVARAHTALGELEPARGNLIKALALEPENPVMLAALVDVERRTGRYDAAAQALGRLEKVAEPGDPRLAMMRGELLVAQQRFTEAAAAFEEAQRRGMGGRAAVGLFDARRRGGMADPAAPLLAWLEQNPTDTSVRAVLADHYLATGNQRAAIGEYEQLVEASGSNPQFLNNLAWLYGEASDPRGIVLARRAHELAPANPMIADTLGWLLYKSGEHARAKEMLEAAVAGAPQAGDVRYRYAVVLAETGDRRGAIREARTVLANNGAANYHKPAQELLDRLEQGKE